MRLSFLSSSGHDNNGQGVTPEGHMLQSILRLVLKIGEFICSLLEFHKETDSE
jgi:hypothetical protein